MQRVDAARWGVGCECCFGVVMRLDGGCVAIQKMGEWLRVIGVACVYCWFKKLKFL